jgi:hypothetical protein
MRHEQFGRTALHCACWANNQETARCLLDAGAAIEARDNVSEPEFSVGCGIVSQVEMLCSMAIRCFKRQPKEEASASWLCSWSVVRMSTK